MKDFKNVKEGDRLRCINQEGWGHFKVGGFYCVTSLWDGMISGPSIDLAGHPVSGYFAGDFELVEDDA